MSLCGIFLRMEQEEYSMFGVRPTFGVSQGWAGEGLELGLGSKSQSVGVRF